MHLNKILLVLASLFLLACNVSTSGDEMNKEQEKPEQTIEYPKEMSKIFEAHGGLSNWKKMKSLSFEIKEEEGNQLHKVNLHSRKSILSTNEYVLGNNGESVWLKDDSANYKGNPRFTYNLMFYFYAMPFVLGDNGILYKKVDDITLLDKTYKGMKISYNQNVGESSEDEYIVYYDSVTHQMEWLAYTVTYFSKEKSEDFHFTKYDSWNMVNGLKLPKKMVWYKFENDSITDKRGTAEYVNAHLSPEAIDDIVFEIPEGAKTF